MSLLNLFKISYYFDNFPGYTFPGFWVALAVLLMVFIMSLSGSFRLSRDKKISGHRRSLWSGWANSGYLLSIGGLFWIFFRYQGVAYLNWRIWPALLLLGVIGWVGYLIYLQKKILPQRVAEQEARVSQAYYFRRRRGKK